MIKATIDVAGYWSIVLFVNVDYDNFEIVESALTDILATISIVCINKATSREELINTISHEADHIQDVICDYYDVPLDSEQAAYLIGYLVGKMYYKSRRLFCSY